MRYGEPIDHLVRYFIGMRAVPHASDGLLAKGAIDHEAPENRLGILASDAGAVLWAQSPATIDVENLAGDERSLVRH